MQVRIKIQNAAEPLHESDRAGLTITQAHAASSQSLPRKKGSQEYPQHL
jgi:hypothetical protein